MTKQALISRIRFSVDKHFLEMRGELPIKTGRLSVRAFQKKERRLARKRKIKIFVDLKISPYAVYLNDKRKTKGWWENAARRLIYGVISDIRGLKKW